MTAPDAIAPPPDDATPRVAFVLFQVAQERNFLHGGRTSSLARAVQRLGIEVDLFETTVPGIDAPAAGDFATVDDLAERLRGRFRVVAYTRLWSEAIFRRLHASLPGITWVYVNDDRVAFDGTDYAVGDEQPRAIAEIVRGTYEGRAIDRALLKSIDAEAPPPASPSEKLPRRVTLGLARPDRPAVVNGSPGCAYNRDVRVNPRFADVPIPSDRVVTRGCSFCNTGGVARLPAEQVLTSVLAQLDEILAREPDLERVQLEDQNPLPFLVPFVERVAERATRPMEILLETRSDWFLGGLAVFEKALAIAERTGHRILLFLVGIENFSPRELELFNKGCTPEQNERAVLECRRLKRRYPKAYSDTRAAFGFILYDPWTEPGDLAINAMAAERIAMHEFRGQLARAKLRLYPDTALYYKALHDELLAEKFPYEAMDSARRYGYEAEVPWRFQNPATDAIYGIHDAIFAKHGKHHEMRMLLEIVRFVQRSPQLVGQDVGALADALVSRMGSRFEREIRHESRG